MKGLVLLSQAAVEAIQARLIDTYGGSHGLRDAGLLASALARPMHLHTYEPEASIGKIAASLAWGLVKNHCFIDGNKRIALAALVTFLDLNGCELNCTEVEETGMVLRAAASEIGEAEWNAWVEHVVRARR